MPENDGTPALNNDQITIIWNEYKDLNEWERHNEDQRAHLSNILLVISAALIALLPKDHPISWHDWPTTAILIVIGVFGILAVIKYWERFNYHLRIELAYRTILDSYFPLSANQPKANKQQESRLRSALRRVFARKDDQSKAMPPPPRLFISARDQAVELHESKTPLLLQDGVFMQHWLWIGIFGIVTGLGIYLTFWALAA